MSASVGPIKEVSHGIYDGPHATPPEADSGPVFLGIKNVTSNGRLDLSEIRHVSEEHYPRWTRRVTPQANDIVFSYEATLHRYALIPEGFRGCLGRRMALIRPNTEKVVPRFLHYYFLCNHWRSVVESNVISGATVDRIPLTRFPDFEIRIPDVETQTRIASTLSTYDDLTENNRRRIQLLEQAARLLYKEWFVRLRFPGHEHVKVKDGVPEGWERRTYAALFKFLGGFPFKSKTYQSEGKFGIVTIKNVHDARFVTECPSRLDSVPEKVKEHCVLNTGDILLSLTGNVGRACIVFGENYLLNQRVAKVVGNTDIPRSFTYWTFSNETIQKELENLAYGVAQLNLSPVKLGEREFLKPSPIVLELFGKIADPIFQQIITLNLEIVQLSQSRDLLLPRLMSGEIPI